MKVLILLLFLALPAFAQDFYDEDVPGQELGDLQSSDQFEPFAFLQSDDEACGIDGPSPEIEAVIQENQTEENL